MNATCCGKVKIFIVYDALLPEYIIYGRRVDIGGRVYGYFDRIHRKFIQLKKQRSCETFVFCSFQSSGDITILQRPRVCNNRRRKRNVGHVNNCSWKATPCQLITRECRESRPKYTKYVNNINENKQL